MKANTISIKGLSTRVVCGICLMGASIFAHAGLFDDEEARRRIAEQQRQVAQMQTQLQALSAQVTKLEEAAKNSGLLDLMQQVESVNNEINKLRGDIEVLHNSIDSSQKRQKDMYVDLDSRLRRLEQQPAAAAPTNKLAPESTGSIKPATSGATDNAVAPSADPASENRAYEAAYHLFRRGNYPKAIDAFQNFLKNYPNAAAAASAQYWIGNSYFAMRDYKNAIAAQQRLITNYPDSPKVPDAMLNIASSQIELGNSGSARKTLEQLASKHPNTDAGEKAKRRLTLLK